MRHSINTRKVRQELCGADRIPADFQGEFSMVSLWDVRDKFIGIFNVVVRLQPSTHKNPSMHRIMVKCKCGRLIPIGRLMQHKCKVCIDCGDASHTGVLPLCGFCYTDRM